MEFHGSRAQILKEAAITNDTAVVYTVPVGKKFFLIESMLKTDAGAAGVANGEIRTEADAHVRNINFIDVITNDQAVALSDHFEPGWPVEMAAGEDIAVTSDTAALEAQLNIFGFEVDA